MHVLVETPGDTMRERARWWLLLTILSLSAGGALAAHGTAAPTRDGGGLIQSRYYKVRIAAARTLGARGDARSLARLDHLLLDPHPLVRLTALHALRPHGLPVGALERMRHDADPAVRRYARALAPR